ncbi:hypothetical protein QCA50_004579 [Cerrena zonata]|uniref:NAD-P-binding protein n=1 Tax=Cerrena zonata TaxID=2478898 RepID=A0AAW0GH41_9APHY
MTTAPQGSSPKVWFITGAGSGFGRIIAEFALEQGDSVIATSRTTEKLVSLQSKAPSERLLTLGLDVSNPEDITKGFAAAKEKFGRIDVVFNNAGYAVAGELEGTPTEAARRNFETNFWGSAQVSLEAVKFFREVNGPKVGGRLLVTGSLMGVMSSPAVGYYVASKHALQGFHESLTAELDPEWNIKLTIVVPGTYHTAAIGKTETYPPHPAYNKPTLPSVFVRQMITDPSIGADPIEASRRIMKLTTLDEPPNILILGRDAISAIGVHIDMLSAALETSRQWAQDPVYYSKWAKLENREYQ